ncbi:hypothetical protein JCM10213_008389, partial [Rhodosporidiobolus nylandii]
GTAKMPEGASKAAEQETWKHEEKRARALLLSKMEDGELSQVVGLKAPEIWSFLLNKYELGARDVNRSIVATLNLIRATSDAEIDQYLQQHEELLAHARKHNFPLVEQPAASASKVEKERVASLNMCYSDRILANLPPTADWQTFQQIYEADKASTWAPREVIDKIRAHHTSNTARATSSVNNPLLGNISTLTGSLSPSSTALSSTTSSRPACTYCGTKNPRHSPAECFSNPSN